MSPHLARNGPQAMSAIPSLTGINRTWSGHLFSVAFDPTRTSGLIPSAQKAPDDIGTLRLVGAFYDYAVRHRHGTYSDFRCLPCPIKHRSFLDIVRHGARWSVFCCVPQCFGISIQTIYSFVCLAAGVVRQPVRQLLDCSLASWSPSVDESACSQLVPYTSCINRPQKSSPS
jgi:hypothetical protein